MLDRGTAGALPLRINKRFSLELQINGEGRENDLPAMFIFQFIDWNINVLFMMILISFSSEVSLYSLSMWRTNLSLYLMCCKPPRLGAAGCYSIGSVALSLSIPTEHRGFLFCNCDNRTGWCTVYLLLCALVCWCCMATYSVKCV